MVGLGERAHEVRATIEQIRRAGVEILTIGQYLQPTAQHLAVDRWVHPDEFAAYREHALALGFAHCESGPLVRSSYHAHEHVRRAAGGGRGELTQGGASGEAAGGLAVLTHQRPAPMRTKPSSSDLPRDSPRKVTASAVATTGWRVE